MPILDIRAGSAAASNVNQASNTLIEALHARSKGISENIQGVGNHLIKHAALSDEMETNESKRNNLDADTTHRKKMNEILYKQGKNGAKSLAEQQIQGAITAQNLENAQKEQLLTPGEDGKSAYQKQLEADRNNTISSTALNYERGNYTKQTANGVALGNAITHTNQQKLLRDNPHDFTVYGTTLAGTPNFKMDKFWDTGAIYTPGKNGKLLLKTKFGF